MLRHAGATPVAVTDLAVTHSDAHKALVKLLESLMGVDATRHRRGESTILATADAAAAARDLIESEQQRQPQQRRDLLGEHHVLHAQRALHRPRRDRIRRDDRG